VPAANEQEFGQFWVESLQRLLRLGMAGGVDGINHTLIILGQGGLTFYRPVLTTLSIFNNDDREASIYFMEIKRRVGHGDESTTKLLEGIDAICRFRFLFLEKDSLYNSLNADGLNNINAAKRFADELMAEIYYLENDLIAAGLDKPASWAKYVAPDLIKRMSDEWFPLRTRLFSDCLKIISCQPNCNLQGLVQALEVSLSETQSKMLPHNSLLLSRLTSILGGQGVQT
jgi:hypothetical protein